MNKNNVPYYIATTLATLTLLASGVFAVAPYVGFLAPVAALSVGLPFIIGCAVFSVVTIALSYKAISKNKTISEKDVQLAGKNNDISHSTVQLAKGKVNVAVRFAKGAVNDVLYSGKYAYDNYVPSTESAKEKLSDAFDAVGNGLRNTYSVMPSVEFAKDIKTASQKAFASVKEAYSSGRVPGIVKRGLTDVYGAMPSTESVKGTLSGIGNKLKNVTDIYDLSKAVDSARNRLKHVEAYTACEEVGTTVKEAYSSGRIFYIAERRLKDVYGIIPSAKSARSWVPSLKTAGCIAGRGGRGGRGGGAGGAGAIYIAANGGLGIAGNPNAVGNPINGTKGDVPILLPVCPRVDMQCQIDEYSNELKNAENNFGIPKEGSPSSEGIFSSIYNKVSSAVSSVWGSLGNLASGSNKGAHDRSEPQWHKDLYKSETMEEIMDGGILGNLFSPRVDNGINTSKQQGTFIDSVELKRLTKELPPSAYPNGSPRAL